MDKKIKYGIITNEEAHTITKILLNDIFNGCSVCNCKYSMPKDTE
jgi:hypothetical protein